MTDLPISACVASIVRVVAFNQVDESDITYTIVTASVWTTIEQTMGIICACLPTIRPLFSRLLSHIKNKSSKGTDNSSDARSDAIQLSTYNPRPTLRPSTDSMTAGFARLDEEEGLPASSISTSAFREPDSEKIPVAMKGIMRHQTLQQHVEDRSTC